MNRDIFWISVGYLTLPQAYMSMNISTYILDATPHISPSAAPALLWSYYISYLWNYEPDSWVATIAYSTRILAILVSLPLVILALLASSYIPHIFFSPLTFAQDIASYAIARTLGVIDDVKASTSDKATVHFPPSILIGGSSSPNSESTLSDSDSLTDHSLRNRLRSPLSDSISEANDGSPPSQHVFYADDSENNLKLSGVGVFSPAASQPPSPIISRQQLNVEVKDLLKEEDEGVHLRRRVTQWVEGSNTSSGGIPKGVHEN